MHDVKLLKTRIGAFYNYQMQGLKNGYVQLVRDRLEAWCWQR